MKPGHIVIRRIKKLNYILSRITGPMDPMPDRTPRFSMLNFRHSCGAPACQAGWWLHKSGRYEELETGYNVWRRKKDGERVFSASDTVYADFLKAGLPEPYYSHMFGAGTEIAAFVGVQRTYGPTREEVIRFNEHVIEQLLAKG